MRETTTPAVDDVIAALEQLAVFRSANASESTIQAFAYRLVQDGHALEDILTACTRLERRPRAEGEPAFPSLATFEREIAHAATARRARARVAPTETDEPTFRCAQCLDTGWIRLLCRQRPCGRDDAHYDHSYVVRCACWLRQHAEALLDSARKALQDGGRPSRVAEDAQDALNGTYRYRAITSNLVGAPEPITPATADDAIRRTA